VFGCVIKGLSPCPSLTPHKGLKPSDVSKHLTVLIMAVITVTKQEYRKADTTFVF
jgi:hypothetical protein